MRNVLGEELFESISESDSSDESVFRPLTPTPKSDRNHPRALSQKRQAKDPPSRPANSFYDEDGYEPTALEGRRKLNRDVLRAVGRLAPQNFDTFAQRFYPKAWTKRRDRQMQREQRQDQAPSPADQTKSVGPLLPKHAPSPALEPPPRPKPTQYEPQFAILRLLHQNSVTYSQAPSQALGSSTSANAQRPALGTSQSGPDPEVSKLIERIKKLRHETVAAPRPDDFTIFPTSARPSSGPSLTATAPAPPWITLPRFAHHIEDINAINPLSTLEQDNGLSTTVEGKSEGSVTSTQEDNARSTSPSSVRSDQTVIYIGPTAQPTPRIDTPSIENETSVSKSCFSNKDYPGITSPDTGVPIAPMGSLQPPDPGNTPPNTPQPKSLVSDTYSESRDHGSSSQGRDSSDSDGEEDGEAGDGDGDKDKDADEGDDEDKDEDENEDEHNEDEDKKEDGAEEDSAESESNVEPASFRGFDETYASYRLEDATYHDQMVLRRWADVLDWWAD
ncbi:hypothetical protein P171DRAFT_515845 [Karstenula rhodostoma CBS 690.94]|uniref:Uncharacterized protein n=1 Tax=Karstenula rhodostoma CBS 690.94 TaxID=1392251 RepID=A0A9P4UK25_9PLEO|nr:hypothetical protein P171DRAFT_515845 [Karstenula rhodostoma CBS 690.94]